MTNKRSLHTLDSFSYFCFCSHIQSLVELESVIVATGPYFEHNAPLTYSLCQLCCNSTHVWEKDMEVKISKFILEHPLISMASDMCAFTMDIESYQNTFVQIRDQKITFLGTSYIVNFVMAKLFFFKK